MAEQEAKDTAAKTRIITHLNNDHHESLVRYLEHYCKVPSWQAYDVRMSGISLEDMTFECRGKTHRIPLDPPMSSYRDARERAVQMDQESLNGLRRSHITIKEFSPPTGIFGFILTGITFVFITYSQRCLFEKGQIVEQLLGPGFARFSYAVAPYIIGFILFAHGLEALYMALYKLPNHSVNSRSRLFWQWTATTFAEGGFAFLRFNDLVRKKQEAKAKQQH